LLTGCAAVEPVGMPLRPAPTYVGPGARPIQMIVLDAGHGGHDPGASHHGLREKDLNLDIVRRLRSALQAQGLSVTMTRDSDEFISLSRRPAVATRVNADLFISVHVNANNSRHISGIEVYYPRESQVNAQGSLPPRVHSSEVVTANPTIRQILWDLLLSRSRNDSRRLAMHICRAMRSKLRVRCRGVHGARFVVLREARMPAVLVEVGYVSNPEEAQRLGNPSYRQAAAEGIAQGIIAYVRQLGLQHI